MNRPTHDISTSMVFDALEILADQNELDDQDPQLNTVKTPVWAASIRDAVNSALETGGKPTVRVTPDLADFAEEALNDAAASAQEGGRYSPTAWHALVSGAYAQYVQSVEDEGLIDAFKQRARAIIEEHDLDSGQIPSFEKFREQRDFDHVSSLPDKYQALIEGSDVTEYCVKYPGPNLLGYNPETGEAWFQDYKQEYRGPLEEIERKFYLWAIAESDLTHV